MQRISCAGPLGCVFACLAAGVGFAAQAGAAEYSFTNIADTTDGYTSFRTPRLADDGSVLFKANVLTEEGLFTGPDPVNDIVAGTTTGYYSFGAYDIGSAEDLVFVGYTRDGDTSGAAGVFTGSDPTTDRLAHTDGAFAGFTLFSEPGGLQINASGGVIFGARLDDGRHGLFTGGDPTTSTFVDSSGDFNTFEKPTIANSGKISFGAALDEGRHGIFDGPDPVNNLLAIAPGPYDWVDGSDANSSGSIIFKGTSNDGVNGLFSGPDPLTDAIVTNEGDFQAFMFVPTINDDGDIAFMALRREPGSFQGVAGIYGGSELSDKVIEVGDELFGSTVASIQFEDGLNNHGQIAFSYMLGNGVNGIAVATIPEPGSLALLVVGGITMLRRRPRR